MAPATAKTAKEGKSNVAAVAPETKKPKAHPPYSEMINEAITALKERTGSSQFAIAKFIEEKQKANLPTNFKKLLLVQLKKLVANEKLVKVKNSFKLPSKSSPTAAAAKKSKSNSTDVAVAKKPIAKSTDAAAAAKKLKSKPKTKELASIKTPAKKPKTKDVASMKSPAKKAVVAAAKAKKPKSIKSPVKKAAARKAKK